MRIIYSNPIHQLNLLIDTAVEEKMIHPDLDVTIHVTKDEMISLIRHADARKTFTSYFEEQDEKRRKLESKIGKLHAKKERLTTLEEREQVFDEISSLEAAIAALSNVPMSVTSRGIPVVVTLRG